MIHHHETGKLN